MMLSDFISMLQSTSISPASLSYRAIQSDSADVNVSTDGRRVQTRARQRRRAASDSSSDLAVQSDSQITLNASQGRKKTRRINRGVKSGRLSATNESHPNVKPLSPACMSMNARALKSPSLRKTDTQVSADLNLKQISGNVRGCKKAISPTRVQQPSGECSPVQSPGRGYASAAWSQSPVPQNLPAPPRKWVGSKAISSAVRLDFSDAKMAEMECSLAKLGSPPPSCQVEVR